MKNVLLITAICLLFSSNSSQAYEQGSLKRCQTIKNKIQLYTDKRRQGGSAASMLSWRKKRNNYNSLHFLLNCKKHQGALK